MVSYKYIANKLLKTSYMGLICAILAGVLCMTLEIGGTNAQYVINYACKVNIKEYPESVNDPADFSVTLVQNISASIVSRYNAKLFLDKMNDKGVGSDFTNESLSKAISVTAGADSFTYTVTTAKQEETEYLNRLILEYLRDISDFQNTKIIIIPVLISEGMNAGTSGGKRFVMGGSFGFGVWLIVAAMLFRFNNTVKGREDLSNNTDLEVIGAKADDMLAQKIKALAAVRENDIVVLNVGRYSDAGKEEKAKIQSLLSEEDGRIRFADADELTKNMSDYKDCEIVLLMEEEKVAYPELKELSTLLKVLNKDVNYAILLPAVRSKVEVFDC